MTASSSIGGTTYQESTAQSSPRRLYRSRANRTFAGVCAGIAEYFGADVSAVRLATLLLVVLTGIVPGLAVYVVAALIVPEAPGTEPVVPREAMRPGQGTLLVGLVLVVVGTLALTGRVFRVDADVLGPMGLIAIGAVIAALAYRR